MAWIYLFLAGLCEICWAAGLKRYGFNFATAGTWLTVLFMGLSFFFLSLAMRVLPVGVSYAVWVGVGAAGVALYGMVVLGESTHWQKWAFLTLIVSGVIGLSLSTAERSPTLSSVATRADPTASSLR